MPEQLCSGECRRDANVVAVECRLVGIHAVEQERLRVRLVGQSARQLKRRMQVAVDQARRRHRVPAVHLAAGGIGFGDVVGLADGDNLAVLYGDRRIANDAAGGVDGYQPVDTGNHQVNALHVLAAYLLSPT